MTPNDTKIRRKEVVEMNPEVVAMAASVNCRVGKALARDPNGIPREVVRLTHDEMRKMLEYSASIPTGKVIGKRWRCRTNNAGTRWIIGGYEELSVEDQLRWPGHIAIITLMPVVDGDAPGEWKDRL